MLFCVIIDFFEVTIIEASKATLIGGEFFADTNQLTARLVSCSNAFVAAMSFPPFFIENEIF